jgi:OOP family OmpA-OmpF porin
MELGEGAPQGWAGAVAAAIRQLVRLENGAAETKDAAITISGLAADEAQAQSVRAALRASVPSNFSITDHLRNHEVKAPPPAPVLPAPQLQRTEPAPRMETPSAAGAPPQQPPVETSPKQATPAPQPPSEPAAKAVPPLQPPAEPAPKQQAAPAPPPAEPSAKQQATPAPQPSVEPAPKQQAAQPQSPPEPVAKQGGSVPSQPVPPKTTTASAPPAVAPQPEANACQESLNKITRAGHINFATDSATLDSASFDTLDRLAAAAKACPAMHIAIEGHTDAEGSAGYNQRLSVRRARAVAAYLVKAGADRKQLEAVGYGLSRPAAPNDTEENMARNRRIEFIVRQQ